MRWRNLHACYGSKKYSESATAIARPQRNSACCGWLPKGPSHKHFQMWKSYFGYIYVWWYATAVASAPFPTWNLSKMHCTPPLHNKDWTIWPSCQLSVTWKINFVSVKHERWQSQSDHLNEWTLSRVAFLQVKCWVVRVANKMSSD